MLEESNPTREPTAPKAPREAELGRLLEAAMELLSDQWRPFLEGAASELALAREAEALLRGEAGLGDFLEKPAVTSLEVTSLERLRPRPTPEAPEIPDGLSDSEPRLSGRLGPFVILDELGQGGMGTVYLAEQHKPGWL